MMYKRLQTEVVYDVKTCVEVDVDYVQTFKEGMLIMYKRV